MLNVAECEVKIQVWEIGNQWEEKQYKTLGNSVFRLRKYCMTLLP